MELRSGVVEGVYYTAEQVAELANLPSKKCLSDGSWEASNLRYPSFAYLLQAIIDKQATA